MITKYKIFESVTNFVVVNGEDKPIHNSLGKLIHPNNGIINFWKWFGNSVVVDDNDRPLVVYHGTNKDFDEFKSSKFYTAGYFAKDNILSSNVANTVTRYHGGSSNVIPVYLSIKNPLILTGHDEVSADEFIGIMPFEFSQDIINQLQKEYKYRTPIWSYLASDYITEFIHQLGYDGIIFNEGTPEFHNRYEEDAELHVSDTTTFIPFNSNQIKSVWNNGNFSNTGKISENFYQK